MQRLSAPTRSEIDAVHKNHSWMQIGTPSLRNLYFINPWRTRGWLVLFLSSLPIHLLYNSAVFSQISATDYSAYLVDPSFTTGATFSSNRTSKQTGASLRDFDDSNMRWLQQNIDLLTNLSATDCFNEYAQQVQTGRGDVLAIAKDVKISNNSYISAYDYTTASQ